MMASTKKPQQHLLLLLLLQLTVIATAAAAEANPSALWSFGTPQEAAIAAAADIERDRNFKLQQQQQLNDSSSSSPLEPFLTRKASKDAPLPEHQQQQQQPFPPSGEEPADSHLPHHVSHNNNKNNSNSTNSGTISHYFSGDQETVRMWMLIGCSALLVAFAGISSGLTTGFMAFDELQLLVLQETGTEKERAQARKVHQLLSRRHQLLVTLLVANSLAMEALPLFLDKLVSPLHAVLLAVTLILFVGEIFPQAVCTGRNQLAVAALMTPLVRLLLVAFAFVAIPVAALLDRLLQPSHAAAFYGRNHLRALIGLHQRGRRRLLHEASSRDTNDEAGGSGNGEETASPWLNRDEVMVIQGALDMASKSIGDFLVPLNEVYQLEKSTKLTPDVLLQILRRGHSRIPVYEGERHNIRGILLVKSLICVDPGAGLTLGDVMSTRAYRSYSRPLFVSPSINPYTLLNAFQETRCHLAFVTPDFLAYGEAWRDGRPPPPEAKLLGIVTLEDVIEQLIQEEIMDEFDGKRDISRFAATRQPGATLPLGSCGAEASSAPLSPLASPLKTPTDSFCSTHSAADIATAPCILDATATAAAAAAAAAAPEAAAVETERPHRAAASTRSAAGDYSCSPVGFDSVREFSGYEQQQQQRVGVYIHLKRPVSPMGLRHGHSKTLQQRKDTMGRWVNRRCFTQPLKLLTEQQKQQQQQQQQQLQQGENREDIREPLCPDNTAAAADAVPYAVLLPSPKGSRRDSSSSSNSSSSRKSGSSRTSDFADSPQVLCLSKRSIAAATATATAAAVAAVDGLERVKGYREGLMQTAASEKETPTEAEKRRLPGTPNGDYALLPDVS